MRGRGAKRVTRTISLRWWMTNRFTVFVWGSKFQCVLLRIFRLIHVNSTYPFSKLHASWVSYHPMVAFKSFPGDVRIELSDGSARCHPQTTGSTAAGRWKVGTLPAYLETEVGAKNTIRSHTKTWSFWFRVLRIHLGRLTYLAWILHVRPWVRGWRHFQFVGEYQSLSSLTCVNAAGGNAERVFKLQKSSCLWPKPGTKKSASSERLTHCGCWSQYRANECKWYTA